MTDQQTTENQRASASDAEPHLRRALGAWGAAAFVVTNMVGTGIFTLPAFVRSITGNGVASLAVWALGAGLALSGALCYAELATRMPHAGGEYYYLTRIYGRLWGFLSGWISFLVGFSAAIAASSLGAADYASRVLPIGRSPMFAAILIIALTIFHTTGVRPSGRLQTIIALSVIGAILIFFFAGVSTGRGDWGGVTQGSESTGVWWVALILVTFAYSGWNAAAYLAGEVKEPRRTLPRALIGGTLAVGFVYLLLNVLFLYAMPADSWEAQPKIAIGTLAAERLFGASGAKFVSAIIALAIIGSVSSMIAAGPRVYYAMARDGLAHSIFGRLDPRTGAPVIALALQAIVAMTLALTGQFDALVTYAGSALSLFAALAVASLYVVRRDAAAESKHVFRTPGYPVTPAIYLILTVVAFLQGLRERPGPTGAALLTILAGVVIFYIARSRGWLGEASEQKPSKGELK
ncbi:MAG: APC family permease [Blastocatellales bacterium]